MTENKNFTYNTIEEYLKHLPEELNVTGKEFVKSQILMGRKWYENYLESSHCAFSDDYAYIAITTNSARYKIKDDEGRWVDYICFPLPHAKQPSESASILKAVDDLYKFVKENHPDQIRN